VSFTPNTPVKSVSKNKDEFAEHAFAFFAWSPTFLQIAAMQDAASLKET
jgi:hypothetical protein